MHRKLVLGPITVHGDADIVQAPSVSGGSVRDLIGQQINYGSLPPAPATDPAKLAAAMELLAQMPVGDEPVPLPGPLAPYSYLHQLAPNPLFTGRDAELRTIAGALRPRPGAVAVTTGMGGVGKTQLAIEFAHRYGPFFAGGVFWASLAEPETAGTAIAGCGSRGLVDWRPDFGQLRPPEQIALVCTAWQSPLPRLIIFDNCEDPELLHQWRPPTGGCRILVTSRRAEWGVASGVMPRQIGVLERAESARLLQGYRPDLGEVEAGAVAAVLGDLPLALHLAGSFLRRYRGVSATTFLAQLDSALLGHSSLQGRGAEASPSRHVLSVAQTFAMSYDRLDPAEPANATARLLIARAACLAPGEPIPRDLLLAAMELPVGDLAATLEAEDGLVRLIELGLIEQEAQGTLRLHRVVRQLELPVAIIKTAALARSLR